MSGAGRQGQGQTLFLCLSHFLFIQSKLMSGLAVEWENWRLASAIRGLRDAFALPFINVKDQVRDGVRIGELLFSYLFGLLPYWHVLHVLIYPNPT
ncbi:hypothetical protein V6N13_127176 [Hibiscus sabdariffa]|uniref:Uncharacterized protein n=1 Tax=Hibiscus sabdariffa TaxID=183260 RepID=A0ABR2RDF2_9ROSI